MEILWFAIGAILGLLVAWFYLGSLSRKQMSEQEARLLETNLRIENSFEQERSAHEATKQLLSEMETRSASTTQQIASLNADLDARRQELESVSDEQARLSETNLRIEKSYDQERSAHEATKQLVSEMEAKDASIRQQIASLNADLDASRQELESVKADAAEKGASLSQLQAQSDGLEARLHAADEERARLDAALKQAQRDHDNAIETGQSKVASLEARLHDREEAIGTLEAELAALRAKSEGQPRAPTPENGSEQVSPSYGDVSSAVAPDDLTRIKGIGPVLNEKLHGLGITSFQQIADFTQTDIDRVNKVLDFRGRIEREKWVSQAKAIASGVRDETKG